MARLCSNGSLINELVKGEKMNDPAVIGFIRRILSVAETGRPEWDPSSVYIYNDGPKQCRQITLSIGFTEFGGNLKKVLAHYCSQGGELAEQLNPYLDKLGDAPSKATDTKFLAWLKQAGKEELMASVQIEMFESLYLGPAIDWGEKYG